MSPVRVVSRRYLKYYKLPVQVSSLPLPAPTRLNELSDLDRFSIGFDNLYYVRHIDLPTRFYIVLFGQIPTKCLKVFRGITSHLRLYTDYLDVFEEVCCVSRPRQSKLHMVRHPFATEPPLSLPVAPNTFPDKKNFEKTQNCHKVSVLSSI